VTLILNNDDVKIVLTMEITMKALEEAYREVAASEAVCRPRIDVSLRLGNAPAPWGLPELDLPNEYITYAAVPNENAAFRMKHAGKRAHGAVAEDRAVLLADLLIGKKKGRTSSKQITYSERGNIQGVQGAQFFAVAGKAYELAKKKGLGKEIPTDWLLQDIRD
jgi:ornithine cyclodeaminase/alanine dehydrogenase-like protein (mu-crystallin family)